MQQNVPIPLSVRNRPKEYVRNKNQKKYFMFRCPTQLLIHLYHKMNIHCTDNDDQSQLHNDHKNGNDEKPQV